jgi:hypothetical protein
MTIAELEDILTHSNAPEDDLADELYGLVKDALRQGQPRDEVLSMLDQLYVQLAGDENEVPRRATREVIGCFHGYCAPDVAL